MIERSQRKILAISLLEISSVSKSWNSNLRFSLNAFWRDQRKQ